MYKLHRISRKGIFWILLNILILSIAIVFYYQFDPSLTKITPKCPVKLVTGYSCPSCGAQRALHALLHGNTGEAIKYNYFFILSIPYLIVACIAIVLRKTNKCIKVANIFEGKILAWVYVIFFFVWFVLRNILGI